MIVLLFARLALGCVAFVLATSASANERIVSREQALREGFRPVQSPGSVWLVNPPNGRLTALSEQRHEEPQIVGHALPWPVDFQDSAHTLGNAMVQFQPFGDPYFHGGCDLRVRAGADIRAPISGKIEAGHYTYSTNADGSLQKYWAPWPKEGDPMYFEVAVVGDNGIRFEFHHVNSETLPEQILRLLNLGNGAVSAGTVIGHVIAWPDGEYHHTHYNVILPNGVRLNPEFVSKPLPDHLPPEILGAFAIASNGETKLFGDGHFVVTPAEFVVAVIDRQDDNIYEHPPALVTLRFGAGETQTLWDFRERLISNQGTFPELWEFFKETLVSPDGRSISTEGGYGMGQSLIRIKLPEDASGPFTIEISDIAGNTSALQGIIAKTAYILR